LSPTHDGLGTMNRQLLDLQGPIPGMTPAQALTAIQTVANHSHKWYDRTSNKNIESSSNSEGIVAIVRKLDNLVRDMKKLKENVHVIQVGCQICSGAHLDKHCPPITTMSNLRWSSPCQICGFSDNEKQETDNSGMAEALAALKVLCSFPESSTPKEQDPGSFILPCSIGKLDFNNILADLGASLNVMPLFMYKRLGIGKLKPINMVIEMADNTKCTPKGIVENLLIKINKFIFPVDFVILDMVKDLRIPIILERPLLAIAHAKVDIFRKSISLEVGSKKVIFKMRSSFTTTFESVRSIRSDTCPEDDDFKKIDYDLFLYDSGSCEFNRFLGIDPDIFSYEIDVQESYEKIVYRITEVKKEKQSRPKERRVHWCKAILQEKENESEYWPSCDPNHDVRDGGDSPINKVKHYWEIMNNSKREEFGVEDDLEENLEDPEECGEDKANTIMGAIHDKLNDDWFNNTSKDEDDLEGILVIWNQDREMRLFYRYFARIHLLQSSFKEESNT
ncbi:zinc knuckle CX2CX4HX4C containing protein, partial [Tanacetum coccineum]